MRIVPCSITPSRGVREKAGSEREGTLGMGREQESSTGREREMEKRSLDHWAIALHSRIGMKQCVHEKIGEKIE